MHRQFYGDDGDEDMDVDPGDYITDLETGEDVEMSTCDMEELIGLLEQRWEHTREYNRIMSYIKNRDKGKE